MTSRSAMLFLFAAGTLNLEAAEKPKLSFVKDIVPIFTKAGCANSNCHGSIRGQAGFKLSLFGYEPDLDYDAIVKAQDGRRINRSDPARSLILLKPSFAIPHGGGKRFAKDSLEYRVIEEWIAAGAPKPSGDDVQIKGLDVFPAAAVRGRRGSRQPGLASGAYQQRVGA